MILYKIRMSSVVYGTTTPLVVCSILPKEWSIVGIPQPSCSKSYFNTTLIR